MEKIIVAFVHNNVNICLLKYYLEINSIKPDNIIIFYQRVTLNDLELLEGEKIDYLEIFKSIRVSRSLFFQMKLVANDILKNKIKGSFILIVPHLTRDMLQYISSSKQCEKIIYLEEGEMSYCTDIELNVKYPSETLRQRFSKKLWSLGRLYDSHAFPKTNKVEEAIGLSDAILPSRKIKRTAYGINEVFRNTSYPFSYNYDNSIVFLLDRYGFDRSEYFKINYENKLKDALSYVRDNLGTTVYFKPHPALNNHPKLMQLFLNIVKDSKINAIIISDVVEFILANFKNVKLVCHQSSLIRYAVMMGHTPYQWGLSLITDQDRIKEPDAYRFIERKDEIVFI
ncbi:MAG: hypothetical protein ACO1OF_20250 [Adhaeribacter sp.]